MNYIDEVASDIGNECDMKWPSEYERKLLRIYAVLCLAKGEQTCRKDVHDAWAAWRAETDPKHGSLIPFGDLHPDTQGLDNPYCAAIRRVAVLRKREEGKS